MISVVIPTYNRAAVLPLAVSSVLNESFTDLELIVVDDGSTDATLEVLDSFADSRLRVVSTPHVGVSHARNQGIAVSRYDWVAFLDSDDRWHPRKLQRQLEDLERQEGGYLASYTDEIWIRNGRRVNPRKRHRKFDGWIFRQALPICIISPSSILLHRRVLERIGNFDESLRVCEDYALWLRLCAQYPVRYLPERLIVKTGGHADQLSRSEWAMDRFRLQALRNLLEEDVLTEQQRIWAAAEAVRKAVILRDGALKRGRPEAAEEYERQIRRWS
jgi:glycosyltransferase involved in cell wall biosynthesis